MGRSKRNAKNKTLPKILQLWNALDHKIEENVVAMVLAQCGWDEQRALSVLLGMLDTPAAPTDEQASKLPLLTMNESSDILPHLYLDECVIDTQAPAEQIIETVADNVSQAVHEEQVHGCRGWWPHLNTFCLLDTTASLHSEAKTDCSSSLSDGAWGLLCDLFDELLTVDELARIYQESHSGIEEAVEQAFALFDQDGDRDLAFQVHLGCPSRHQNLAPSSANELTNEDSLGDEHVDQIHKLISIFPERDRDDILAALIGCNFDLDAAVTALLGVESSGDNWKAMRRKEPRPSRTYADAVARHRVHNAATRSASVALEDFPSLDTLRNTTRRSRNNGSSEWSQQSTASIFDDFQLPLADRLKLKQIEIIYPKLQCAQILETYMLCGRNANQTIINLGSVNRKNRKIQAQNAPASMKTFTYGGSSTASPELGLKPAVDKRSSSTQEKEQISLRQMRKKKEWEARQWTVVETAPKKRPDLETYTPGLHNPATDTFILAHETNTDTEEYWREQADKAHNEMIACFRRAAHLHRLHGGDAAHEISLRGHEFKDRMQMSNSRAAACVLRGNNAALQVESQGKSLLYLGPNRDPGHSPAEHICRVDLHGLRVREALEFLHSIIEKYRASSTSVTVEAITGIGRNSVGGQARLLPSVRRMLTSKGISHTINGGCIRFRV